MSFISGVRRCGLLLHNSTRRLVTLRRQLLVKAMSSAPVTVGLVVIGDEIIKGQVQDVNSFYMCQRLHQIGVQVKTVVTVPDDLSTIAKYVKDLSSNLSYVITAGGIGPTHDDITYEAIAAAFSDEMKIDSELESIYKSYFKEKYTASHRKLSTIPQSASLFRNNGSKFPIVHIQNVFMLPGVPKFLKMTFSALEAHIGDPSMVNLSRTLYLTVDEMSIAAQLTQINNQFGNVTIGSYPEWNSNYYKVRIVLESNDVKNLDKCEHALTNSLPAGALIDYDPSPLHNPCAELEKICDEHLQKPVKDALAVCREALSRYKLEEICIGFNGGKDCTALLHLWYAVASESEAYQNGCPLKAIYIRNATPFAEEEMFIEDAIGRYKLDMMRYSGDIKGQLVQMKEHFPNIKAVIMGTRSTDPHGGNLCTFQSTDEGWPELMRINPILNFTYTNVWELLRRLSLPYCRLYDLGYTSLGRMESTHLNPALRYTDSNGVVCYRPAYQLTDPNLERAGRYS